MATTVALVESGLDDAALDDDEFGDAFASDDVDDEIGCAVVGVDELRFDWHDKNVSAKRKRKRSRLIGRLIGRSYCIHA